MGRTVALGARPVVREHVRVGVHRGRRRLWLEGRRLERAGIRGGDRFDVGWSPFEGAVVLTFGPGGERVVSRRRRDGRESPVIDVGCRELDPWLGTGLRRAEVSIEAGRITVVVHPDDAGAARREARLRDRLAAGAPLEVGSLAHGGGVLDHALHEGLADGGVPTRLAFAVERDAATVEAAAANNPAWDAGTTMVVAAMEEVDPSSLPEVDVLVAGLPCTGASRAGRAKNAIARAEDHPTAGHLFVALIEAVRATNPSVVVVECVPEYAASASAAVLRRVLGIRGYAVTERVLDGNAMGALDQRRRWCLVASPPGLGPDLAAMRPVREREASLGAILDPVGPDDPAWREIGHMHERAERNRAAGRNFSVHHSDVADATVRTMGAGYARWRGTEPKIAHPTRPGVARLLTPEEHARAKTVPIGLVAGLSPRLAHHILGNGVVHAAFRAVGRAIARGLPPGRGAPRV